jgi:hypothetical protein
MLTIFLFGNLFSSQAFPARGAEFLCVILDSSENWANCFFIHHVDALFSLPFDGYEVAFKQWFKVMRNHALFLSYARCEFVDAHWFLHELFKRVKPSWVCQISEEAIADFRVSFLHSRSVSPF